MRWHLCIIEIIGGTIIKCMKGEKNFSTVVEHISFPKYTFDSPKLEPNFLL